MFASSTIIMYRRRTQNQEASAYELVNTNANVMPPTYATVNLTDEHLDEYLTVNTNANVMPPTYATLNPTEENIWASIKQWISKTVHRNDFVCPTGGLTCKTE